MQKTMAEDESRKNKFKPHAIFVAYPLQGHVIPFVHLATKLASRGFTINYINTLSIHQKTSKAAKTSSDEDDDIFSNARKAGLDIRYTTISDGLPVAFDRSLNHDQFMASLIHVFSAHVEEVVAKIVGSGEVVHCLVADTFFVWPSKIANKFGLQFVSFWTEPALVFNLYYHLDLLRINRHFDCQDRRGDAIDYIPGIKSIEPKDLTSYLQESDTTSICHQLIFKAFDDTKNADFVLCNTIQEFEPDTISALHAKIPYFAIGPIFPVGFTKSSVTTSLWSESDCTPWLDSKPPGSVLYVSFGSYAHVKKRDLIEIANGLALSNVSFLWVLRPDIVGSDDPDPLPVGYKEAVADRSMIIPWCSQRDVLTHRAIGGFLTHCGWNSILESMWCKVPLLCFPLYTDQFTNRKLVVDDWKIGLNLISGNKVITKEEVCKNVNDLICGKSGSELRNKVKEKKQILENALSPNGSSEENMARFIEELKTNIEKTFHAEKPISNGN